MLNIMEFLWDFRNFKLNFKEFLGNNCGNPADELRTTEDEQNFPGNVQTWDATMVFAILPIARFSCIE